MNAREDLEIKADVIPSIHKKIRLKHIKPNGKIISDKNIQFYKQSMKAGNSRSMPFDHDGVYGTIMLINNQYYASYGNEPLGVGGFGSVEIAQNLETGTLVAVKTQIGDEKRMRLADKEHKKLDKLGKSPGAQSESFSHTMIMTLESGFELKKMNVSSDMSTFQALQIGFNVMQAVSNLHATNILHCDIKGENFIVNGVTGEVSYVDLGVAKDVENTKTGITSGKVMGTPGFIAPEIREDGLYSEASEVFALGKTLGELYGLTMTMPYTLGDPDYFSDKIIIAEEDSPQFLNNKKIRDPQIRKEIHQLLTTMTDPDPERRPSLADAKSVFSTIMDNQLEAAKIRNVGVLNILEYKMHSPKERAALIKALKNCDEVCFVNPNNAVSKTEMALFRRELENERVNVGEQLYSNHTAANIVSKIPNQEKFNADKAVKIPIYITMDEASAKEAKNLNNKMNQAAETAAEQLGKKISRPIPLGALIVNTATSEKDFRKEINLLYLQPVSDVHIVRIIQSLKATMEYLNKKYENDPNGRKRVDHIQAYLTTLESAKDNLSYQQLFKDLKSLQEKMQLAGTLSNALGIKSTSGQHISTLSSNIRTDAEAGLSKVDTRATRKPH